MKFIIDHKNSSKINAAFRVIGRGNVDFYTSTRIGGIIADKDGFVVAVPDVHTDKEYELKDIATKKVISSGRIENRESVVDNKIEDKKQKAGEKEKVKSEKAKVKGKDGK